MALLSEVKYETKIRELKDISPEAVLFMLRDVRADIGRLDDSFLDVNLAKVLITVESGQYEVNGSVSTRINLSSAKDIIDAYRKYSEGGCQSCASLGIETIDAQDATSGWFCEISDPDYNKNAIGDRPRVRYKGFSPKVNKHYQNPCSAWKPRFSLKLDELVKKE
ncbi:hypothetical protein J4429_02725 [Candidatus Pacearchaeota archaeon]|nr:hypothetical protein [Candidatus Pacearchaeota archaeon]